MIIDYDDGPTVGGLMKTDICSQPGDSGGAVYSHDHAAVGIVSGGTVTSCEDVRFRSYAEDVVEAVNSFRRGAFPHIYVE